MVVRVFHFENLLAPIHLLSGHSGMALHAAALGTDPVDLVRVAVVQQVREIIHLQAGLLAVR